MKKHDVLFKASRAIRVRTTQAQVTGRFVVGSSDLSQCCTLNPDKGIANTVHQESVGYTGFLGHFENKTQMFVN